MADLTQRGEGPLGAMARESEEARVPGGVRADHPGLEQDTLRTPMTDDPAPAPTEPQAGATTSYLANHLLPAGESSVLSRFAITNRCCHNPDCDCQEIILELRDPESGEQFSVVVPLDRRALFIRGAEPGDVLLRELQSRLGLSFWEQAKRFYEAAKEYGRQHPWEYLTVERGLLVPYYDLAPGPEEVLEFTHNGQAYLVVDQYCLEPDCDCREVLLDVQLLRNVAPGKAKAQPFALTYYDFRGSRFAPGPEGPLTSHRRHVMATFMSSRPDMPAHLWSRYELAKEIGLKVAARGGFIDPEPARPGSTVLLGGGREERRR
jgi:hypothetical protein